MKKNEGPVDRVIRFLLAVAFGYTASVVGGPWVWIAGALAALMLVTSLTGFCPTYTLFGIDTRGTRRAAGSIGGRP